MKNIVTRLVFCLLVIGIFRVSSEASVARNDSGTNAIGVNGGTSPLDLTTFTVSAGSNQCLVVFAGTQQNGDTETLTWDQGGTNQAMTVEAGTLTNSSGFHTAIYRLIAPTTGNKTLRLTWSSGTVNAVIIAINFSGADQTTCLNAADDVLAYPTGSPVSIGPITSTTDGATVAVSIDSLTGIYTTTSQTEYANSHANTWSWGASYALGGTSNTHSFTNTIPPSFYLNQGVHVLAASGGGGGSAGQRLTVLGVGK